ncbi:S-crystallin SL11-like [Haliotis rubra]|uniref:S-crystallin SL11-like n=1 Tax=Haliotis rubra TaxID=36100 RepID=UPI001EE55216|nr:S-crystallin SL11-like [Haliotis rubra]
MACYRLTYFNVRGRAELTRLCFAAAGVNFDDVRIPNSEWAAMKSTTRFGMLPILEVDGKKFSQSFAMARYIAREHGLYGKTNLDMLQIDEVVGLAEDLRDYFVKIYHEKDEPKKNALRDKFDNTDLPRFLGYFEKLLTDTDSSYFVGNKLSLADLAVYDVMEYPLDQGQDILKDSPKMKAHRIRVGSHDNLHNYLKERVKTVI